MKTEQQVREMLEQVKLDITWYGERIKASLLNKDQMMYEHYEVLHRVAIHKYNLFLEILS